MVKKQQREVYWTTITYRSVFLLVVGLLVALLIGWKIVHPSSFDSVVNKIGETIAGDAGKNPTPVSNEARFVNLAGRVQVRKIGQLQFQAADYQMTLAKGDVIQTGGDGQARISFANGTTYTVQPETLITVESNTLGGTAAAQTSVSIKSGAVDLTTTSSSAEVAFEDAVARVNQNSKANVRSDPETKQHEITLTAGSADLRRGGETIPIVQFERVSFETGAGTVKSRILAPPDLLTPLNLQPLVVEDARQFAIKFEWKPVTGAVEYHLRISKTSTFSDITQERKVNTASASLAGFSPGDYFWVVTAIDAKKGQSQPSEVHKFTFAERAKGQSMLLETDKPIIHGTVVEINGRTEPGAVLIINGQPVARIEPDGKFKHFTPSMTRGAHRILIQGQNRRGGTAQLPLDVLIP